NYPPYPPYPNYPPYPPYPPPFDTKKEEEEAAEPEPEYTQEPEEEPEFEPEPEQPLEEEEKTEEEEEPWENPVESTEELLEYLEGLTNYLPEEEKREYSSSDIKLRMKALQSKLKGHGGLRSIIERQSLTAPTSAQPEPGEKSKGEKTEEAKKPSPHGKQPPINTVSLENTFSYLKNLSSYLPDQETGLALGSKMRDILRRLHKDR
ncbi:MAG: hypothetical protein ACLFQW_02400, partial [Spirochaetaceae bacterium]